MTSDDLLNVKRKTAEIEQRGVRTRSYQEIHVTRLDRIPPSYRTEHTHVTQAALGRGRENLPPSRPKRPEIGRPFLLRWTGHDESFPRYHSYSCPSPLHGTRGRHLSRHVIPSQPTGGNTRRSLPHTLGEAGKQPVQSFPIAR
jgi:hypothetical protein